MTAEQLSAQIQEGVRRVLSEFWFASLDEEIEKRAESLTRAAIPEAQEIEARKGYLCNHYGPEGECDWKSHDPIERCPFHGTTTHMAALDITVLMPAEFVDIEIVPAT